MPTTTKRRSATESVNTDFRVPTLSEMIRDGRSSAGLIKRGTSTALLEWLKQSERLNIARTHYVLRGGRFTDFADRLGVDRSSAFQLVKLWLHRKAILKRCQGDGKYYAGKRVCIGLSERQGNGIGPTPTTATAEATNAAPQKPYSRDMVELAR